MVLLIDMGNTTTTLVLLEENKLYKPISFNTYNDLKGLKKWLQSKNHIIHKCLISSVFPSQSQIISESIEDILGITPIFINITFKSNLKIELENVETFGNDLFVNSVGAQSLYPNRQLLVIDFGTAITYDYISKEGIFKFGLITLGIESTLESLFRKTAQLPKVEKLQKNTI